MTIQLNHITKTYSQDIVLDDITMKITDGEHIAIVGENGCGKSTLLKIIAKLEPCQEGEILISKQTTIAYLHQLFDSYDGIVLEYLMQAYQEVAKIQEQMQALEDRMQTASDSELEVQLRKYGNLQERFEHMDGYQLMTSVEQIAQGLHFDHLLKRRYSTLSGGEKARVNLARQLLQKPDVLLLDEPTNHLDFAGIRWLENYLMNLKETVIIVSHDRTFLNHTVKKIYEISWGELQMYQGNYDAYRKQKQERFLLLQQDYEQQQKEIKKLQDAIRRFRQWGLEGDNEKFYKKAKMLEKRLEQMERIKRPQKLRKSMRIEVKEKQQSSKKVMELKDVSKAYENHVIFDQMNASIFWRERIAVCGENGTGKSTLIKMIMQEEEIDQGEFMIAPTIEIGYLPQMIQFPKEDQTLLITAQYELKMNEENTRRYLIRFGFDHMDMSKRLSMLSGGERTRLKLAFILSREVNMIIFDEPTNHLDVTSIEIIETVLNDYTGTLLVVSHDRYFIQSLCDKVWMIKDGMIKEYLNESWMEE